jgi:hypothetical protein
MDDRDLDFRSCFSPLDLDRRLSGRSADEEVGVVDVVCLSILRVEHSLSVDAVTGPLLLVLAFLSRLLETSLFELGCFDLLLLLV